MKYLFRILCVVFMAQIRYYGKFMTLHKLILIVLQLTNQIIKEFPAQSCSVRAIFLKLLWGQVVPHSIKEIRKQLPNYIQTS